MDAACEFGNNNYKRMVSLLLSKKDLEILREAVMMSEDNFIEPELDDLHDRLDDAYLILRDKSKLKSGDKIEFTGVKPRS